MGEIKVRRLADWIIDVYRQRAARSGQSVEEEGGQALKSDALKRSTNSLGLRVRESDWRRCVRNMATISTALP